MFPLENAERKGQVITMSKSVSETLREQGVVLTEAPNFEQPMETAEKTKVELAMEMTNTNISKKCRKAFNKFVKKYELEIDFEKYEGKTDELMELINKTATDDEEASLVRHMKSYCKSVLANLSKADVVGINGALSKEEFESVNVMDTEEISESKAIPETSAYDADKRTAIEAVMKQMQEEEAKEEADKVSMTSKPEAKIESVPTTSVTKKTTTRYIEKEPKMTEYRKAGKINQYFDDLKIWQQQYTA